MANSKSGARPIIVLLSVMSALFLVGLFSVLAISIATPIEMADDYHMGYQDLEKKYDQIINKEELFDSRFVVLVDNDKKFAAGENELLLKILDKKGGYVGDANVSAYITRPDTSKFNIDIKDFKYDNGEYRSSKFNLDKEGRWIASIKVEVGDAMKYVRFEGWATRR